MKITVYTKPNCMPCRMTKRMLDDSRVPYKTVDVEADETAAEYLRGLGIKEMPVVEVDLPDGVDRWSGHRADQLRALTSLAGGAA